MTPQNKILHKTKSLCPVCLARVEACYREEPGGVFFEKECPEHGAFSIPVWSDAEKFENWRKRIAAPQPPVKPIKSTDRGCPYDCGLCENHRQVTCCVLFEVTFRCDLNCPVCFASAGEANLDSGTDVSVKTISGWYDILKERGGPFNIQLSGGEPAMRDDLPEIIGLGRKKGFEFFQLNTNGLRISRDREYLRKLSQAGLNTVFLQFDTLSPEHCITLRGRDIIAEKKRAIANCGEENVGVVLVPTVKKGCNDGDLGELINFAARNMPVIRGVHFQPMSYFGRYSEHPKDDSRMTIPGLLAEIESQTEGKLKAADFSPGGAEHPLCSFHADYTVNGDSWQPEINNNNGCCCSSSGSDMARQAVAQKWSGIKPLPAIDMTRYGSVDIKALDEFLARKRERTLAVSGMAFQDAWTADLERLQRCHINIMAKDGKLIPFCSCNITSSEGRALHR